MVGWESNAGGKKEKKFSCKPSCQRNFCPRGFDDWITPMTPSVITLCCFPDKIQNEISLVGGTPVYPIARDADNFPGHN